MHIPDLVVLAAGSQPDVLTEPPLLIIEILSPDDTYTDTQERCQDYRAMGVETIWSIDPRTRTGRMCAENLWVESSRLTVQGSPLMPDLPEIFQKIQPEVK